MALARTDIGAFSRAGTSDPFVTSSFTPPNNSLLVVCVTCEDAPGTFSADVAVSGGGLTWTKRASADDDAVGGQAAEGSAIFTAPVVTGASMTLSITGQGGGTSGLYVRAFAFTGYDVATPIGGVASFGSGVRSGAQTSLTMTLSASPAASSIVLGLLDVVDTGSAIGPGPSGGFTEIFEDQLPVTWQHSQTQVRTGSTSSTIDWSHSSMEVDERTACAIEIREAAATGTARNFGYVCG